MGWFILAVAVTVGIVAFLFTDAGASCLALFGVGCLLVAVASFVLVCVLLGFGCVAAMVGAG